MSNVIATVSDITDAVETLLQDGGSISVGRGQQPKNTGWQGANGSSAFVPYVVLHRVGGDLDGSIAEPHEDIEVLYQPTCVGATAEQAERLFDRVLVLMLGGTLEMTGRYAMLVDADLLGDVKRDDTVEPPVFIARPRFRVFVSHS